MIEQFHCGSGHQWSAEGGDGGAACPVCGAAGEAAPPSDTPTSEDPTLALPARPISDEPAGPKGPTTAVADDQDRETARARSAITTTPVVKIPGYEILEELGRGGMGVVYKARHVALGREVALKVVLSAEHSQPLELARFRAEAETAARLQHPNIVPIFELGEANGRPYIAMELISGGSLKQRLERGPLPDREAAGLLLKLTGAAGCAHAQGIVHRDLKPDNVLLTADGEPKIADFGVAKRPGGRGLTATGAVLGTPAYMAPEQAKGDKSVGPPADLYSLGAILYECLAGRPPFVSDSMYDTLHRLLNDDPVSPAWFRPRISRDLETICLKCLRKEPPRRYGGADELAEDLRRFLAGEPVRARPIGLVERTVRWARRKPALAAFYGLLAAALLLGGGGALWYKFDRDAVKAKTEKEKEAAERRKQLTEQTVRADLAEAELLRGRGAWAQAKAAVERAHGRLGAGGPPELADQVRQASADLAVVAQLEDVQTNEAGAFDARRAEDGYAAAFRSYGLDLNQRTPEEAAERIRASAVREQLLASLDDWIYVQTWHKGAAPVDTARLRTCVRLADDDARRQQFRDLADRQDAPKLKELARDPKMLDEPPLTLVLLGMNLGDATAEETLLRRARLRYPSDFWLSYELARVLDKQTGREKETLECYWTALALRPQNEGIYCEICPILKTLGKLDEAADVAAKAVQINGDSSDAHFQLGGMLERRGEIAEAVAEYQKAIQLRQDESRNGNLHWNIALLRLDQGRREEARQEFDLAAEAYRRESDQDPDDAGIHCDLGQALLHEGRFGEAVQCLRRGDELSARQNVQETSCQWRQEAERQVILDSLLPAVLKGEAAPIDSAAEAALAETAQMSSRRLFAASTRLYSQAFAADPTLEGQLGAVTHNGYRYDAACAAALAAAAQGEDAHGLSAEERDALRRQAVNWLRAELNELAPVAAPANTAAVLEHPELIWYIHRTLKIWQGNADLAVLRDEAALAGLPQEGREECRKLWAGVEALAARTAPAK